MTFLTNVKHLNTLPSHKSLDIWSVKFAQYREYKWGATLTLWASPFNQKKLGIKAYIFRFIDCVVLEWNLAPSIKRFRVQFSFIERRLILQKIHCSYLQLSSLRFFSFPIDIIRMWGLRSASNTFFKTLSTIS